MECICMCMCICAWISVYASPLLLYDPGLGEIFTTSSVPVAAYMYLISVAIYVCAFLHNMQVHAVLYACMDANKQWFTKQRKQTENWGAWIRLAFWKLEKEGSTVVYYRSESPMLCTWPRSSGGGVVPTLRASKMHSRFQDPRYTSLLYCSLLLCIENEGPRSKMRGAIS